MAMLPQVVVAPRSTVAAHNVDFPIGVSQLDQQIVKKIKLLHVVVLDITGAVVAKKMIQLRNGLRKILISDAVDHVDMFAGMKVVKTQPVVRQIRPQNDRRAREHTQQTEADKELSADGVIACHRALSLIITGPGQSKQRS
jgi:hypothetical protein